MYLHFSVMLSENRLELVVNEHFALCMEHVKENEEGKVRGEVTGRERGQW